MDRARRSTAGRRKLSGASASPLSNSELASALNSRPPASPVMAPLPHTHQPAPQQRRASRSLQQAPLTSSPPGAQRPQNHHGSKKRSKAMDDDGGADEDEPSESPQKGGHSLRNQARVNYLQEHIDDDVQVPRSSSSRARKQRPDLGHNPDDLAGSGVNKTGGPVDLDTSSSTRRRSSNRKISAEAKAFRQQVGQDESKAQDTIQVGVSGSVFGNVDAQNMDNTASTASDRPAQALPGTGTASASRPSQLENGSSPTADASNINSVLDPQLAFSASILSPAMNHRDTERALDNCLRSINPWVTAPSHLNSHETAHQACEEPSKMRKCSSESNQLIYQRPDINPRHIPADTTKFSPASSPKHEQIGDKVSSPKRPSGHVTIASLCEQPPKSEDTMAHGGAETQSNQPPKSSSPAPEPTGSSPLEADIMKSLGTKPSVGPGHGKANTSDPSPASPAPETALLDDAQVVETEDNGSESNAATKATSPSPSVQGGDVQSQATSGNDIILSRPCPSLEHPVPLGPRGELLTPYVYGEYDYYRKKKSSPEDEITTNTSEDQTPLEDENAVIADDLDDGLDAVAIEDPTPAINTTPRGSPARESRTPNSPSPDEVDVADSQELPEQGKTFRYRKIRDPEDFLAALRGHENLEKADLSQLLDTVAYALAEWQNEYNECGKVVDDYENAMRRRAHEAKYHARLANGQHHIVEPEFVCKGYKAREKEARSEKAYLMRQDRIMADAYGFEHDSHPSKIGCQDPETQQAGIMTRGRSLRNQPKQTAKATEAEEVATGKKQQRRAVQNLEPPVPDASRSCTPAVGRGRRRRVAVVGNEEARAASTPVSAAGPGAEMQSPDHGQEERTRKQAIRQGKQKVSEEGADAAQAEEQAVVRGPARPGRRARGKNHAEENGEGPSSQTETKEGVEESPKPSRRRHLLTLKMPKGKNLSEPSSAITDNGDSRPSTASSESSSHTIESSYSFRPKRQKRFRDEPEPEYEEVARTPKKRAKRAAEEPISTLPPGAGEVVPDVSKMKIPKIKVVGRVGSANPPPPPPPPPPSQPPSAAPAAAVEEGDEAPKDYRSMTKSEKMSASMKNRWANGNMAQAVEKRKATLAAKKAAQAAANPKGLPAPKMKKPRKEEQVGIMSPGPTQFSAM